MQNGLESDVVTNTGTIGHKMVSLHIKGQHHKKIGRSPSTMLNPSLCLNDDQHKEPMIDTKIIYRVSQKNILMSKIITKTECCVAKFYHGHDLGALDPA